MQPENLDKLIQKCIESGDLTRDEIIFALSLEDDGDVMRLLGAGMRCEERVAARMCRFGRWWSFRMCALGSATTAGSERPTAKFSDTAWGRMRSLNLRSI